MYSTIASPDGAHASPQQPHQDPEIDTSGNISYNQHASRSRDDHYSEPTAVGHSSPQQTEIQLSGNISYNQHAGASRNDQEYYSYPIVETAVGHSSLQQTEIELSGNISYNQLHAHASRNGRNECDVEVARNVAYQSNPAPRLIQTDIPVEDNIAYLPHSNGHQDEDYVN